MARQHSCIHQPPQAPCKRTMSELQFSRGAAQCCHQKLSSWAPTQIGRPQSSAVKPASRAGRLENTCMPVKGRACAATVIQPAAPPEANAECKISCTPARPVMLLRLTRAERAGACEGAVKPTAPKKLCTSAGTLRRATRCARCGTSQAKRCNTRHRAPHKTCPSVPLGSAAEPAPTAPLIHDNRCTAAEIRVLPKQLAGPKAPAEQTAAASPALQHPLQSPRPDQKGRTHQAGSRPAQRGAAAAADATGKRRPARPSGLRAARAVRQPPVHPGDDGPEDFLVPGLLHDNVPALRDDVQLLVLRLAPHSESPLRTRMTAGTEGRPAPTIMRTADQHALQGHAKGGAAQGRTEPRLKPRWPGAAGGGANARPIPKQILTSVRKVPGICRVCKRARSTLARANSCREPSTSHSVSSAPWKTTKGNAYCGIAARHAPVASRYSVALRARVAPCQHSGSGARASRGREQGRLQDEAAAAAFVTQSAARQKSFDAAGRRGLAAHGQAA